MCSSLDSIGIDKRVTFPQIKIDSLKIDNIAIWEKFRNENSEADGDYSKRFLKIIQLGKRGIEGKFVSSFRKGVTKDLSKIKIKDYIKDKLWLSSINPIRVGILETYQRSESLKFKFNYAMEILK